MSRTSPPHQLLGNVGLNLLAQLAALAVYVASTPTVVHGLGNQAYGLLAVLLVVLGYFSFLDLGMSQATVKFVSEHLAHEDPDGVRRVVWTALLLNLGLGVAGGVGIALAGPMALPMILKVDPALRSEAGAACLLLAIALPFVLAQGTLQGVLAAQQRFRHISLLTGLAGVLQPLCAVVLVRAGLGVKAVVLGFVAIRALTAVGFALVVARLQPGIPARPALSRETFRRLIGFGGWVLVSYFVGPLLVNSDRLLVGALLGTAAVAYYAVPNDIAARLLIVSGSLTPVLFAVFSRRTAESADASAGPSARGTTEAPGRDPAPDRAAAAGGSSKGLLVRSVRLLFLILIPAVALLAAFAGDLFRLWMGPDFMRESAGVLKVLAVGVLINSVAAVPFTALWGLGRPDLTAKFHLLELPLHLGLCAVLIMRWGIEGAAFAWLARAGLDLVLLLVAVRRWMGVERGDWQMGRLGPALGLGAGLALAVAGISRMGLGLAPRALLAAVALLAYGWITWRGLLDDVERRAVRNASSYAFRLGTVS
jgi:O-antigen/teichoic acid export membrane protein